MVLNLKNILSKKTYGLVEDYFEYGVDALALMGTLENNNVKVRDVVNLFQALADPFYVNARSDWGSKFSSVPYEVFGGAVNYVEGKPNAFALKFRANNGYALRFPLLNSYYDSNSKFVNYGCDGIGNILSSLQEKLNFKLEFNEDVKEYITTKQGIVKKIANKLPHPVRYIRERDFEARFDPSKEGKTKLVLDTTYNGEKLTSIEQAIAILDFYNAKVAQKVGKKMFNLNHNIDRSKILLASQILADITVSYGINFGNKNNKEIDNALRLQLSNVMASLTYDSSVQIIAEIAERTAYVMTKKLGISAQDIMVNRKNMGIEYIETPNNFHELMFGATKNNSYVKENGSILYDGPSAGLKKVYMSTLYRDELYNAKHSAEKSEPNEPLVHFEEPEFELMNPIEEDLFFEDAVHEEEIKDTAPYAGEMQGTPDRVIYLGPVAEESQVAEEQQEKTNQEPAQEINDLLFEIETSTNDYHAFFESQEPEIVDGGFKFEDIKEEPVIFEIEELLNIKEAQPENDAENFERLEKVFGAVYAEKKEEKISKLKEGVVNAYALKKVVEEQQSKSKVVEYDHYKIVYPPQNEFVRRIMQETTPATDWNLKYGENAVIQEEKQLSSSKPIEYEYVQDSLYNTFLNEEPEHPYMKEEVVEYKPIYFIDDENGILRISESGEVKHNLAFAEDKNEKGELKVVKSTIINEQAPTLAMVDTHEVKRETVQTPLFEGYVADASQTSLGKFMDLGIEEPKQNKKITLPKNRKFVQKHSFTAQLARYKFIGLER